MLPYLRVGLQKKTKHSLAYAAGFQPLPRQGATIKIRINLQRYSPRAYNTILSSHPSCGAVVSLTQFTSELLETGRLRVPDPATEISPREIAAARELLAERADVVALDYPGEAPEVHWPSAVWALAQFFRATQAAVYRDLGEETIQRALAIAPPVAPLAAQHYSVDLVMVFLPELARFVRAASPKDPLLTILENWARQWPLSSVGMKFDLPVEHGQLASDSRLWQYYLERIVARKDTARSEHPDVRESLTQVLGTHQKHFLNFHQAGATSA
jgi:hypothetical protein